MIGVSLKKKKEMSLKSVEKYLEPAYVELPLSLEDTLFIKEKEEVKEGEILGKNKKDLPILAPIGGVVTLNEEKHKIRIKNNGEIRKYKDKELQQSYSKEELLILLKENGICGMGGAGFPTHLKYTSKNIHTLIVNAVSCEPYITSDFVCVMENASTILRTISILMDTFEIKECLIAIKTKEPLLKEKLLTTASEYTKIKVVEVPNLYPMGWEKALVRYLKHMDYKKLPIEKGIVVNNISTIHAIGEVLLKGRPLIERIVTFSGEHMKKPCNIHVKVGTKVQDILTYLGGVKEDTELIINGAMMGRKLDLEEDVILPTTTAVLALPKEELKEEACIKCGKCTENCPSKISPVLIRENKDNLSLLKKLSPEACIECGICSYVCPSKIPVRDDVIFAKEKRGRIL